jgi:hypothetical protein
VGDHGRLGESVLYNGWVSFAGRANLDREYEIRQLEVFLEMVKKGMWSLAMGI